MLKVYGGGIAGLLCGCLFQEARIFEAGPKGNTQHKAVLRFRSDAVGVAVGIDFRKVRVHKGIFIDGRFVAPNIQLSNLYSSKVIGKLADRSIWNLEPCDRFVAPEDFIAQLAARCEGRIVYDYTIAEADLPNGDHEVAISTLPMNVAAKMVSEINTPTFSYAPIAVRRWRIKDSDIFQTIYFPSPTSSLYRASVTGDLLIAEYAGKTPDDNADDTLRMAFGLNDHHLTPIETVTQRFGKIAPIDDAWRKDFIFRLTHQHRVYSLGRFGTWRNLLLDCVLKDIFILKKLMAGSSYDRKRASA